MSLQWITMNPHTKEGLVLSPPVPSLKTSKLLDYEKYKQTLEWATLRQLMGEVRDAGGGDMNLNTIYISACEHYCNKWLIRPPIEPEPPEDTKPEKCSSCGRVLVDGKCFSPLHLCTRSEVPAVTEPPLDGPDK